MIQVIDYSFSCFIDCFLFDTHKDDSKAYVQVCKSDYYELR